MGNENNVTLLSEIYQNASMGEKGTQLLIDKTKDSGFSTKLRDFNREYMSVMDEAASQLSSLGEAPPTSSAREDMSLWMGVQLNTLIDKTPSHMAEMLIQGSTMGIVKGTRGINAASSDQQADQHIKDLAGRLVQLEQSNIDTMKQFLN